MGKRLPTSKTTCKTAMKTTVDLIHPASDDTPMTNASLLAQIKSATDKSPKAKAARRELARRRLVELEKQFGPASSWTSLRTGTKKIWS